MRVSVTITDDMNNAFNTLSKEQNISKDKFIGNILTAWYEKKEDDYKALYEDALKEIERLKKSKHNERGAGRKKSITQDDIDKMFYLFNEKGLSMRAIGREVGYSVTMVSQILNGKIK